MTKLKNDNQILIYPGETLAELLEEKSMTQVELADRLGRPLKTINELVNGKAGITPDTAIQLERVFSLPAHFWLNLESNYQLALARVGFENNLINEFTITKTYPYREMAKLGWIPLKNSTEQIVQSLLDFFGVNSLKNIVEKNIFTSGAQYRISVKKGYSETAITAWLRKGIIDAQKIDTSDFDELKLREKLKDIRVLILNDSQDHFLTITNILAECGVAFVITKNLKNAPVNGVTRWISPKKALIQMSIRGKYSDIFWFSLFHEIAHLLLHHKKDIHIDFGKNGFNEEQETQADNFASDFLISKEEFINFREKFIQLKNIDLIKIFAKKIGVSQGIVVERLQHEKIIAPNQLNNLRSKCEGIN